MALIQDPGPMVVFPAPPSGPPEELIMFVVAIVAVTAILILRPLVKAWAGRLSGADSARVNELEQRVADLENLGAGDVTALQGEVGELHERMDFTERLLAQAQIPKATPVEQTDETTGFGHGSEVGR